MNWETLKEEISEDLNHLKKHTEQCHKRSSNRATRPPGTNSLRVETVMTHSDQKGFQSLMSTIPTQSSNATRSLGKPREEERKALRLRE